VVGVAQVEVGADEDWVLPAGGLAAGDGELALQAIALGRGLDKGDHGALVAEIEAAVGVDDRRRAGPWSSVFAPDDLAGLQLDADGEARGMAVAGGRGEPVTAQAPGVAW